MNSERWRRIEEICQAAIACPPSERAPVLDRLCGNDHQLRTEVEALLAEQDRAEGLLDVPAWEAAAVDFVDDIQDVPPHLKPGRRLGPFVVERRAGAGGMGEVYVARDIRLDRVVAIKVLPADAAADAESRTRLQLEARAVSALSHPHICALFDIRSDDGVDYLVMEYLEGRTLAERMEACADEEGTRRPLPIQEAVGYAAQIADALAAAHRRGITHCDLKPSNVMLTKGGVKLLDFGVSRVHRAPVVPASAGRGEPLPEVAVLGTINYMAPEQFGGREPDARSDLFAFGALLFEMLTGHPAFAGATHSAIVRSILEELPPPVSRFQPLATPALDDLVERCLLKDPDERWDSARLAADELRRIASDITTPETATDGLADGADHGATASIRRWWAPALAVVSLACALCFGFLWWEGRGVDTLPPLQRFPLDLGPRYLLHPRSGSVALSPDGSRVLFAGTEPDGTMQLFQRRLAQADAEPIAGTSDAMFPFFSPDGRWVAFFVGTTLYKVSLAGGPRVPICEDVATVRGASWGDDGTIVLAPIATGGLSKVPSSGGAATPLTRLDPGRRDLTHRWPQMLPGSRAVLFTAHTLGSRYDDATVDVQSLDSGQRRSLVRGYFGQYVASGHLLFIRHDTLFAAPMDLKRLELTGPPTAVVNDIVGDADIGRTQLSVAATGTALCLTGSWQPPQFSLAWHDDAGRVEPLLVAEGGYGDPRLSPRGNRIALTVGAATLSRRQIAVFDPPWREPRRLVSEGVDLSPVWAPDGEHLVFGSDRAGGMQNLYWSRADGTGAATRLTASNNIQIAYSFTPDGGRLAYLDLDPVSGGSAWSIALDLADPERPVAGAPEPMFQPAHSEGGLAFSPDGRWLAYDVADGGTSEVYVQPAVAGTNLRWQVSRGGGARAVWARQATELVYEAPNREVMRVFYRIQDGRFVADEPRPWPGVPRAAADGGYTVRNFDLSPDGRRLLVLDAAPAATPAPRANVTLLLNFFDELRRRAPGR